MSRIPGKLSIEPLTLELFVLKGDVLFEEWFEGIHKNKQLKDYTRNGSIMIYDFGGEAVAEWEFTAAWPSKLAYTDLDSSSNDALKLTVTLVYEGFERVK